MSTNPKRRHHVLPKLYLKGFTERNSDKYIWVYQQGKIWHPANGKHPGSGKGKFNPYKDSIKSAGAERGAYYAAVDADGHIELERYENYLEQLEKPIDPILAKLRAKEKLHKEEKTMFAQYLLLMHKRGPLRNEVIAQKHWPNVWENASKDLRDWQQKAIEERKTVLAAAGQKLLDSYGTDIPDEIRLKSMLMSSDLVVDYISNMTWEMHIAPPGYCYLTGDNPVFFFDGWGFKHPSQEIIFPISSTMALVVTNRVREERYFETDINVVREINRRIASRVSKYAYYPTASSAICQILHKRPDSFYLLS